MGRIKLLFLGLTCLLSVTVFAKKKLSGQQEISKDVDDNVVVGENDDYDLVHDLQENRAQKHKVVLHDNPQDQDCWKGRKRFNEKIQNFTKYMENLMSEAPASNFGNARDVNSDVIRDMMKTRAAAQRAIVDVGGDANNIPAGINLGSYGIMRMKNAILFFHRMKLRNHTIFRINSFTHNPDLMKLEVDLDLNDLHLVGDYERCLLDRHDMRKLYFTPNYGELNLLLKNVKYKVTGHNRYVQGRFYVEHIISQLYSNNILMTYANTSECVESIVVEPQAIQEFLERLKADLDAWMKDYFNDFLLYYDYQFDGPDKNLYPQFLEYVNIRDKDTNDFLDIVIDMLKFRIRTLNPSCASVATPDFTLISVNGVRVQLTHGVLRGMDTFYRQGMATFACQFTNDFFHIISDIGFSSLTLEYRYLAVVNQGVPPLTGMFRLDANDLMFHLLVATQAFPANVDLTFPFIRQKRPQTLVIEGPINRYISNWKHLLEDEIIALMTNTILYHVKQLSTILNCVPSLTCIETDRQSDSSDDDLDHPDYGAVRNDSIEIELPEDGKHPAKKLKIRYYESVDVKKIHSDRRMNQKSKKKTKLRTQKEEKKRSLKRKEQTKADKKREKEERIEESKRLGKELPLKETEIKADDDSSVSHSYQADD